MTAVVAVLCIAALAAGYLTHVRAFPWRPCPRCRGRRRIASGQAHRDCGRCGTAGRVRRLGAGKER